MRKTIVWTVIGLLAVIGLTACGGSGGGGGGATPTAVGTTVNLSVVKDFAEAKTPGRTISFNVTGSSSAGANLTGSLALAISTPTITSTPTGTQTVNVLA